MLYDGSGFLLQQKQTEKFYYTTFYKLQWLLNAQDAEKTLS